MAIVTTLGILLAAWVLGRVLGADTTTVFLSLFFMGVAAVLVMGLTLYWLRDYLMPASFVALAMMWPIFWPVLDSVACGGCASSSGGGFPLQDTDSLINSWLVKASVEVVLVLCAIVSYRRLSRRYY
ncbi:MULTISPECIES: hypothetical protein [unclassified Caballeronia]|uniref:hypothetical protein n=1 Tax=unclassified Caballeronia TaxID=2646786 RepID=UPI0013EA6ACF|nr:MULTISPECIES: hypothetical protein [unclassified Caballeronia]